jgi:hypothetical protein
MEKWSKKYNQWFLLEDKHRHPKSKNLYRFNNYWYNFKKDIMIHNDVVDSYLETITKKTKTIKKESYCKKNGIEL